MKKIMFSEKYGLEQAVLEGRKTLTRRVCPDMIQQFMDAATKTVLMIPENLVPAGMSIKEFWEALYRQDPRVAEARKECIEIKPKVKLEEIMEAAISRSPYKVGEEVAVAQSYHTLNKNGFVAPEYLDHTCESSAGYNNKMFVCADLMPYRIRIKSIKVERLQDISDGDCMKEGIMEGEFINTWDRFYYDEWGDVANHITFKTAREAFAALIDKVSGYGTWEKNPWVYVYEFELIK